MSNILIIEDDTAIAELEKDYLELSEFHVEIEHEGSEGAARAIDEDFDLILLDLMLPGMDGFEICKLIREKKNTPIIMVSAKKEDIDKIRGLGLGADDYMTKPFSPSELVARVKAHLSRYKRLTSAGQETNEVIEIRDLVIDKTARRVILAGEEKTFTTKEFDLLTFWQNIQTMFTPKKNSLRRFGKWNLSVTLQLLPYTSKKYAKRSKKTPQSQNILKRSGASDIVSASDPFRILDIICISNCISGIGSQFRL